MTHKEMWNNIRNTAKGRPWPDTPWHNATWGTILTLIYGASFFTIGHGVGSGHMPAWAIILASAALVFGLVVAAWVIILTWKINYLLGYEDGLGIDKATEFERARTTVKETYGVKG